MISRFFAATYTAAYNYLFPRFDVANEIQKVREQFSLDEMKAYAQEFSPEDFKEKLINLVGIQNEDEAIRLILKTHLLIVEYPDLISQNFDTKKIMDFSAPSSSENLANGRSIKKLSNTLGLNRLGLVISSIEDVFRKTT